ncbi:MAG TPA: tetratricopeptide repeat protein [Vicinamibacterales bacterium]
MISRPVVVAVAASIVMSSAVSAAQQGGVPPADVRMQRLERWLDAVLQHNPGLIDDRLVEIGKLSNLELQILLVDATAVVRIIRTPSLATSRAGISMTLPGAQRQVPRPAGYAPTEVTRLKQLACAIGGLADSAPCEWTRPAITDDRVLASLASRAAAIRNDLNANFIVRRGGLLHSDVVMFGLAVPREMGLSASQQSVRMSISDGHQAGLMNGDLHWELARQLIDLVAAPGTMKPAPADDAMVRRWYVATSAWLQHDGHYDNTHVVHGREIFPDDPDLFMLSGALHESYASPAIQTAVRSAVLPTGIKLAVESERTEVRDAERFLRRATELRPDFAEAHIRLGHVLALMGRDAEAAEHLRTGLAATDEKLLQYYASLFLGAVEERLAHDDASKTAYERAAVLYPHAQSPLLGLSEVARRQGHRDEALRQIEKVYALERGSRDDEPWWTYTYAQGRHADELLEQVQKPFRLTP